MDRRSWPLLLIIVEPVNEALHWGFGEREEWGQNDQGAGSMASKTPGGREQKKLVWGLLRKLIQGAGIRGPNFEGSGERRPPHAEPR